MKGKGIVRQTVMTKPKSGEKTNIKPSGINTKNSRKSRYIRTNRFKPIGRRSMPCIPNNLMIV